MEPNSSGDELSELSDTDMLQVSSSGKRCRRFDEKQLATLTAYYNTGMKGVGKAFSFTIEHAAAETGLSVDQVKVYILCFC